MRYWTRTIHNGKIAEKEIRNCTFLKCWAMHILGWLVPTAELRGCHRWQFQSWDMIIVVYCGLCRLFRWINALCLCSYIISFFHSSQILWKSKEILVGLVALKLLTPQILWEVAFPCLVERLSEIALIPVALQILKQTYPEKSVRWTEMLEIVRQINCTLYKKQLYFTVN